MPAPELQLLVNSSIAPETMLPQSQPLTFTRNFAWIVLFCIASLLIVPVVIAWTASLFMN